ncbi:MAG: hypothetical protein J0L66_11505 [Cytophagales bacterium]|nr:hypothetical protein [Cytophagales bacterium]
MKFNSVKEYFFRLNNAGYQLAMVPLIVFIFHYSTLHTFSLKLELSELSMYYLFMSSSMLLLIVLTVVHFYVQAAARKLVKAIGLGLKLERLGRVLLRRLVVLALVVFLMPVGLVFTHHTGFAIGFVVALLWYLVNWPTPAQVSNLLQLKGDEKEMVLSKGEAFK